MKKFKIVMVMMMISSLLVVTGCGTKNTKDDKNKNTQINQTTGEKENISTGIKKEKTFGSYKLSGARLQTSNGSNVFYVNIENISKEKAVGGLKYIIFTDNKGVEVYKMAVYVKDLKSGESVELTANISIDVIESYDYKLSDK